MLAFEGWDAAGKGGVIRRITQSLEAGDYRVIPTAAPTEEERRYHYLWRFWRDVPPAGPGRHFDRTWYGRVLVERVEGFATDAEWQRAYDEINDFEEQLVEHGCVLQKFWLHISPEEQLARFEARELTPYKQYKITEEDWRNRERWTSTSRRSTRWCCGPPRRRPLVRDPRQRQVLGPHPGPREGDRGTQGGASPALARDGRAAWARRTDGALGSCVGSRAVGP